ncbi:MAG: MarR family winged helix-turn-helix transcriptional regulator [Alphaproteobacteria bacterium]|nr:MarR family winged helix-turn-helix transcriptional regulator [Alphaproteobacteria bacterium]MCL2505494.1 MarR family winged helix-turn-helix transcriptional regulator [Alphaproteobacteria bacterium]
MDRHSYYDAVFLIERVHRYFLELLKTELDKAKIRDINNVQTLILYNIGTEEMTVGELTARGYYLGSNVSYNVKKMVENKYIDQERSPHDKRSIRIKLSPKGLELHRTISLCIESQIAVLDKAGINQAELNTVCKTLRKIENVWTRMINYSGG